MATHAAESKVSGVERFSERPIHELSPQYVVVPHDCHSTSTSVDSMGLKSMLIGTLAVAFARPAQDPRIKQTNRRWPYTFSS